MDEQFRQWWEEETCGGIAFSETNCIHTASRKVFIAAYSLGLAKGRKEGMAEACEIVEGFGEEEIATHIRQTCQAAQGGEGGK